MNEGVKNTDRELWRRDPDSFYSPSIHVTEDGLIGMNLGGHVIVMPIESWHMLAEATMKVSRLHVDEKEKPRKHYDIHGRLV